MPNIIFILIVVDSVNFTSKCPSLSLSCILINSLCFHRFHCLLMCGCRPSNYSSYTVRSALWSNAFGCLYWHLLIDGLFDSMLLTSHNIYSMISKFLIKHYFTGYVCQSSGYCLKAYIFWNESICICSDLVFHSCCGNLLSSSVELLKQGKSSSLMQLHCLKHQETLIIKKCDRKKKTKSK